MAVTSPTPASDSPRSERPRQRLIWSRFHFVFRLLGLTGFGAACVGLVLAMLNGELQPLASVSRWQDATSAVGELTRSALDDPAGRWRTLVLEAGAAAALLGLLVEAIVILGFSATRRSALGLNVVLQGALAAVLLVAVNVASFYHYEQVDLTRDRQFTLPPDVRKELAQLDPNTATTIIVYQRHKVFGLMPDKPSDDFDSAAERKVVEKMRDLVERFRAIGPQIKVELLDTQSRDYKYKYKERLHDVTEATVRDLCSGGEAVTDEKRAKKQAAEAESLRKTIESAPENSLFFCAGGPDDTLHVQRLSFNDFYMPDKTASREDRDHRGNLILLSQGVEPFARRILRLGARKPRIAIATIHEVLSTGSPREIGLNGLRVALEARGFEVTDIVLKKEGGGGPLGLQPAAYSLDESTLEGLENREKLYQRNLDSLQQVRAETDKDRATWQKAPDDEKIRTSLMKQIKEQAPQRAAQIDAQLRLVDQAIGQYRRALASAELDEARRTRLRRELALLEEARPQLTEGRDLWKNAVKDEKARGTLFRQVVDENLGEIEGELGRLDQDIQDYRQRLAKTESEKGKLNEPFVREQRRMTDLKAKLQLLLADCDLLIVPRMTLRNTASLRENIPPQYYELAPEQVEAIKEFMKAGKPVLACFGPLNWPADGGLGEAKPDGLEDLLTRLGIKLAKQTVLFNSESEGFAENRAGLTLAGASVEVPPVVWDWRPGDGLPSGTPSAARPINRIRASVQLTARGLGEGETLDLSIRDPRPIYYVPPEPVNLPQLAAQAVAAPAPNWTGQAMTWAALSRAQNAGDQRAVTDPIFLMTNPRSWNEDEPFPTDGRTPQFEKPKRDKDERKQLKLSTAGLDTRRRGPFPIGVAVETQLPRDWYDSASDKPATVRLAVIGQGGFFTGRAQPGRPLPPAQEKLFVSTINWLLGRDDRLPRDEHVWSYPRVNDTIPPDSTTEYLWLWGVRLGLPVLFFYFGLVVLLFRRLR